MPIHKDDQQLNSHYKGIGPIKGFSNTSATKERQQHIYSASKHHVVMQVNWADPRNVAPVNTCYYKNSWVV